MPLMKRSTVRSIHGCRTCRQRKVKCDEKRPCCSPCYRMSKTCDWTRDRKFVDCGKSIKRQYKALEDESTRRDCRKPSRRETSPPSSSLSPECSDVHSATLDFSNLFTEHFQSSEDSDVNATIEQGIAPTIDSSEKSPKDSLSENFAPLSLRSSSRAPALWRSDIHACTFLALCLQRFDRVVCRKTMPTTAILTLYKDKDERDTLRSCTQTCLPLRLAICAITLLDYALPLSLPKAVQAAWCHYHWAIVACRELTLPKNDLFHIHYFLMVCDIVCALQGEPYNHNTWTVHLQILASLLDDFPSRPMDRLTTSLVWEVFLLDCRAGLARVENSGCFVQCFLRQDYFKNSWPSTSGLRRGNSQPERSQTLTQAQRLLTITYPLLAELASVSLQVRRQSTSRQIDDEEMRNHIRDLSHRQRMAWEEHYPMELKDKNASEDLSKFPAAITSTFRHASLHYMILCLYTHTSLYPRSHLLHDYYRDEDSRHCSNIINTVRRCLSVESSADFTYAHALLLAGIVSKSVHEKREAVLLLGKLEKFSLAGTVRQVRLFLEYILEIQSSRKQSDSSIHDIDWVQIAWQRNVAVLGL